ncbi:hypothetical protein SALBM311S_08714 [Streptomyces alboniger]
MIRTAWVLGARKDLEHLRLRAWAHMLGFRGPAVFSGVGRGCGGRELGRTVGARERVQARPECRL